jgi:hypothetical protein
LALSRNRVLGAPRRLMVQEAHNFAESDR